jgi:xanthine dehydrogenase accessory factor
MPSPDIFDTIARLRATGRPFAVATVLRTADVTSAKAGAKAAVSEAGEILGHLGGACVQGAVRRAAAEAIEAGEPRMIRVKPAGTVVSMHDEDGVRLYKSGCPSGGTVDLLIEPYRLPPRIAIHGTTPVARALAAHARLMGYLIAAETGEGLPEGVEAMAASDLASLALEPRDFVVVASQGAGDATALMAAVSSGARHVAMVASRRKARTLLDRLKAEGVAPDRLDRVKAPAGLDIGAIDPHEIALSVMAEIVAWRNARRSDSAREVDTA